MAQSQQQMTEFGGWIAGLPASVPAANLAFAYLQYQSYLRSQGLNTSRSTSTEMAQPISTRGQRPTTQGRKARSATTTSTASGGTGGPSAQQTQMLKYIVDHPSVTKAQMQAAFPNVRANHLGVAIARLERRGYIAGGKAGPWSATPTGATAGSQVTSISQAPQRRRGRPNKTAAVTAAQELQPTGT